MELVLPQASEIEVFYRYARHTLMQLGYKMLLNLAKKHSPDDEKISCRKKDVDEEK